MLSFLRKTLNGGSGLDNGGIMRHQDNRKSMKLTIFILFTYVTYL